MYLLPLLLSIVVSVLSQAPSSPSFLAIKVDTNTNQLVDSAGRIRFFRGTNSVQKSSPWYPTDDLTLERIKVLQDMGFNALRLGTMWPGYAPIRGSFNETYIETIDGIVQQLAAHGIYSLLDCHQDVYNDHLCGEGFPLWAVNTNGKPVQPFAQPVHETQTIDPNTGLPLNCSLHAWASYYLTDVVGKAFQGLYDNYDNLQDDFAAFWAKVASHFAGRTSVLGYELINEPWCGDIYTDPELLLPQHPDFKNLQPMYDRLAGAIRKVDDQHIIFYEPVTWVVSPTGFTHVPGGDQYRDRSVLSWHYYCWVFDPSNMSTVDWITCHDVEGPDMFYQRTIDMETLGGSSFITEWGANCDGETPNGIEECNWVMDEAEKYQQSWTYWAISNIFNGDTPKPSTVKLLSRTYPQAIAGIPLAFRFDSKSALFLLTFKINTSITLPTEIYLNEELHYPNGYSIIITPSASSLQVQTSPNKILLFPTSQTVQGQQISITILPK